MSLHANRVEVDNVNTRNTVSWMWYNEFVTEFAGESFFSFYRLIRIIFNTFIPRCEKNDDNFTKADELDVPQESP